MNPLIALIGPVIDKALDIIPNKNERERAKEELTKGFLNAAVEANKIQGEINKSQANHKSIFVAGARPYLMWVCGAGLTFQYVIHPALIWSWAYFQLSGNPPPAMDMSTLMPLLLGMLGLGSMRSFDKLKKTQTDSFRNSA